MSWKYANGEPVRGVRSLTVLVVLHTGIDQNGHAFEVTRFVMRADTGGLDYAMPVDD